MAGTKGGLVLVLLLGNVIIAHDLDRHLPTFNSKTKLALFQVFNIYPTRIDQLGFSVIPELSYHYPYPSKDIDLVLSYKLLGVRDNGAEDSDLVGSWYRLWVRYAKENWELRLGLQKIDFGVATLLRPLQWFNTLSFSDPLQETSGVWGLLWRYYFLNNVNLWWWALYGNEDIRGRDVLISRFHYPETGGRVQFLLPYGEMGLSLNYRTVTTTDTVLAETGKRHIPELKAGLDGKWDIGIGLWLEVTFNHKFKYLGLLTSQSLLNFGMDYTFPWGNGYNVVWENLIIAYGEYPFAFEDSTYESMMSHAYPLGFFDSLNFLVRYQWIKNHYQISLGWEHQFSVMVLGSSVYFQIEETFNIGTKIFFVYSF